MNRREQRIGFRLREQTADARRVYLFDCCLTRDVNVMADLRVVLTRRLQAFTRATLNLDKA